MITQVEVFNGSHPALLQDKINTWLCSHTDIDIVTSNTVHLEEDNIQLLIFYRTANPAPRKVAGLPKAAGLPVDRGGFWGRGVK